MSWGKGPGGHRGQHPSRKEKGAAEGPRSPSQKWCSAGGGLVPHKEAFREVIPLSLGDVQSWWSVPFQGGVHREGGGSLRCWVG